MFRMDVQTHGKVADKNEILQVLHMKVAMLAVRVDLFKLYSWLHWHDYVNHYGRLHGRP